jgi:hypothetical protein
MFTPHRSLWRISALLLATAALGGCAARASYVYDEPVVYYERPVARVYAAPPPVYYHYHARPVERGYYAPRAYHARPVHKAPGRKYRAPSAQRHHHHHSRHDDDDRREHRHHH